MGKLIRRTSWIVLLYLIAAPIFCQEQRGVGVTRSDVKAWPASAKRWALVIGIDRYDDQQISPLRGAQNDAKALAAALVTYAGFSRDQVIVMTSDQPMERQPTRGNILRRLSNLSSAVPHDGLLLVSFSGHGIERHGQAFLLPSDAQLSDDVSLLEETAVSVTRMKQRIVDTHVSQVVFLLDACRNDPGGRADAPNPLTQAFTRALNFDARNREVAAFATLYAAAVGQRAYEYTEKKQGYFTWAVVNGLSGAAAGSNGEVTLGSLTRYVQEVVPRQISADLGMGREQRPFATIDGYLADALVVGYVKRDAPQPAPSAQPATLDPALLELELWQTIKNSSEAELFRDYLRKYPQGTFAAAARSRIDALTRPATPSVTNVSPPAVTPPQVTSPLGRNPRVTLLEPVYDAGTVAKGETIIRSFPIKNTGLGNLEILAAKPGCGCTVAEFDKVIPPGGSGTVRASVDTTAFAGPISKSITLETNDPASPSSQLTITAIVKPYVEAFPAGYVRFNATKNSADTTQTLTIFSEEQRPFEILRIDTPVPWLRVSYRLATPSERVQAGRTGQNQFKIDITLKAGEARAGPLAEKIRVVTNSVRQPDYFISVAGVVRP